MGELLGRVKDLSGAFAGGGAMLYAFGYLVVRSRSRALGTDPDFALIDQAYVFAGFRFVLTIMVAFVVTVPAAAALRGLARAVVAAVPRPLQRLLRVVAVVTLAAATLGPLMVLASSGGLFACGPASQPQDGLLHAAVVYQGAIGVFAVLIGTLVATLSVAWLWQRRAAVDPIGLVPMLLTAIIGLHALLLPLQVGAFYPDLKTRELARVPNDTTGLALPLWIIDRGAQRTVLLMRGSDQRFALVTVKNEALDGIATTATSLDAILSRGDLACSDASRSRSG